MKYRRFGRTERNLSLFSLGTMRALASLETMQQTLARAIALGINHLETAPSYGRSEVYLGQALQQLNIPREEIFITSKVLPNADPKLFKTGILRSLENLQTDYLDGLAIHGINTPEHLAIILLPEIQQVLQELLQQGKIHHLGFSTHGALDLILQTINTNLFEFINLHYYYFFQHNAAAIALAAQKDMGIFIISPADKGGKLYQPPEQLITLCQPLQPLTLTYRFLLADPRITTLSIGPENATELEAIVNLVDADHSLTDLEKKIFQQLEIKQETTLKTEQCHQCYQCLPCPENIAIPDILRLRNLAVAYDMKDYGQYRYQMLENAGHWFPGRRGDRCMECGDCLPRCPEQLDIPRLLQDAHQRLSGPNRRRLWEE